MANEVEWDEWHDDVVPASTGLEPDDDDDLPIPSANPIPGDDDDDLDLRPPVTPTMDDDDEPANGDEPADDGNTDMSGIELYLSQFDIEGGIIEFEDGTSSHFNDLEPARQAEILQQLHGSNAASVEEQYGLDENEVGMINYLRANNLTVDELIESMASERVNTLLSLQQSTAVDYSAMSDDNVYLTFLRQSDPEATPEQLEESLRVAKATSTFPKMTATLRTQFEATQNSSLREAQAQAALAREQELDDQRRLVVETVQGINDIGGVQLNDDVKNSLLDRVLEVNEDGDSVFLGEVFSDPTKLFNAAFWYYYGEDIARQKDEYWKKEKSLAYKRGRQDALGTGDSQSQRRSFTASNDPKPGNNRNQAEDSDDWNSLHNN